MTNFSLTKHAENRLSERSSLSREEFLGVLDFDKLVLIGLEQSYSSNSYLFFSLKDSDFFVVVIDVKTNEIITILPIEYWLNLNEKGNYKIIKKLTRNKLFEAVYKQDKKHKLRLKKAYVKLADFLPKEKMKCFIEYKNVSKVKSRKLINQIVDNYRETQVAILRDLKNLDWEIQIK